MSSRSLSLAGLTVAAVLSAMCNSSTSPTAPSPTSTPPPVAPAPSPPPQPPSPPPAPSGPARLEITVNPNPVPFSGQPITDAAGCAGVRNTWFYDQVIRESGGAEVTLTNRVDAFDGRPVNDLNGLTIVVPANGSVTVRTRWCSSAATEHSAQTTFSGRDAGGNATQATSPLVRLLAP
jgi:hypothetical protein